MNIQDKKMVGIYESDTRFMDNALNLGESFDIIRRNLYLDAGSRSAMYYIDGFVKDAIMLRLMQFFTKEKSLDSINKTLPYVEVERTSSFDKMIYSVLSGAAVYIIEGLSEAYIIDTRSYPTRSIEEPENDKVMRGSRDGFTETLVFNTALIRRRIRDTALTMSIKNIGSASRTDVVIAYIKDRVDPKFLSAIESKLDKIKIDALTMGQETLSECLIKDRWYNPFPKIRYTERPDAAAAHILEGSIIIICDNSPSVMILPTSIFDFMQETNDYYFPPLTGSYMRIVRILSYLVTFLLVPIWYLLISYPQVIPPWLDIIKVDEVPAIPILAQILLVELAVDALKLASMNTPGMLGSSLSAVAGLILGDFAVDTGWLLPEVIFYMAISLITNFAQPSFELGYAFKFMRTLIIILTAAFGVWGFVAGVVISLAFIATNRTVSGQRSYLYPLIPWNSQAMKRLLFRVKLK